MGSWVRSFRIVADNGRYIVTGSPLDPGGPWVVIAVHNDLAAAEHFMACVEREQERAAASWSS